MSELEHCLSAYGYGEPVAKASLKQQPEDFIVEEILGFSPSGSGEHIYCFIEKCQLTTLDVVKRLARACGIAQKQVSYAGLKDKQGITRQWFSVHLPGKDEPDLTQVEDQQLRVLKRERSDKKLRRGALEGNQFQIRLRNIDGEQTKLIQRLSLIKAHGFPNLFTEQRFGYQGRNLELAKGLLFEGKKIKQAPLRGLILSSARSYVFNSLLTQRIKANAWACLLEGDVVNLNGSNSIFVAQSLDEALLKRVAEHDVFPAGPLWGVGDKLVEKQALSFETQALSSIAPWCQALENKGLNLSYRPFVALADKLAWNFEGDDLCLSFFLRSGSYATALVRELVQLV